MTASIDSSGELFIVPQNEIEAYALKMWWIEFQKKGSMATIHVEIRETIEPENIDPLKKDEEPDDLPFDGR